MSCPDVGADSSARADSSAAVAVLVIVLLDGDVGGEGGDGLSLAGVEEQYNARGEGGGVLEKLKDRVLEDGAGLSFLSIVSTKTREYKN